MVKCDLLSPIQTQTMHVSGAHNSPVICLEWSPDGELLYSGDVFGKVYLTVIKFQEVHVFVEFTGHFCVCRSIFCLERQICHVLHKTD